MPGLSEIRTEIDDGDDGNIDRVRHHIFDGDGRRSQTSFAEVGKGMIDRVNLANMEFAGFNGRQTIVTSASLAENTPPIPTLPPQPVAPFLFGTFLTDGSDVQGFSDAAEVVYGEAGDDLIFGEAGNDTIFGGSGNNRLIGGAGIDVLVAEDGNDAIYGGADNDVIYSFGGDDIVFGGDGSDTIFGGAGNDTLRGGAGNDVIADISGNDNLDGGDGNDVINALAGDDRVTGGNGDNIVLGGTGADMFYQAGTGTDRILDFQIGIDKIALSSSVTDFQTLIASAQDITAANGDNFVIIANGDNGQFVLSNLSTADLSESDFIFSAAPVFTSAATASVAEGQSAAYRAAATDADGDMLRYSLSGTDAARFTIDADTGEVRFRAAPDFEAPGDADGDNVYDIIVTAFDGTNRTDHNVAIMVTDGIEDLVDLSRLNGITGLP